MPKLTHKDYLAAAVGFARIGRRDLIPVVDRYAQQQLGMRVLDHTTQTPELQQLIQVEQDTPHTLDQKTLPGDLPLIQNAKDLQKAVEEAKAGAPNANALKKHIVASAHALGLTDRIPAEFVGAWQVPATDGRRLEQADTRALDDAPVGAPESAELGRVTLEPGFSLAAHKFDGPGKEARYLRASAVSRQYRHNRPLFEADDNLFLSSGRDVVVQLERDAAVAHARQRARVAEAPQERARLLEGALRARGVADPKLGVGGVAAAGPAPGTLTLDATTEEQSPRFVDAGAELMGRALELYKNRTDRSLTLDECTALAHRGTASVNSPPAAISERYELDETVKRFQADHEGMDYLKALEAVVSAATIPGV